MNFLDCLQCLTTTNRAIASISCVILLVAVQALCLGIVSRSECCQPRLQSDGPVCSVHGQSGFCLSIPQPVSMGRASSVFPVPQPGSTPGSVHGQSEFRLPVPQPVSPGRASSVSPVPQPVSTDRVSSVSLCPRQCPPQPVSTDRASSVFLYPSQCPPQPVSTGRASSVSPYPSQHSCGRTVGSEAS